MGLFSKRNADTAEIERLQGEIAAMSARLQAGESAKHELDVRMKGIVDRLDVSTPPPPAPPSAEPTVDPADIDRLNAQILRMTTRLDELDRRITSISTELANQINELSDDVEAAGGHEPPTDEIVDELRDAQTRLASEQARYQIAFREDLAALADRLRRA